ncbi:MAG TPA: acetyl-CoA carboxylase carboxyltransferase subunit alpha [Candidatus Acidoferrales bacterium]|nr:acetyl-CoA carboxylase carboxyltransferase subunit alpha [Candidatus Acidoferrales bacterium]
MDPAVKAQRQLATIEVQIAELEAKAGADKDARLQLKHLQHQINFLRDQIRNHINAWNRTELARHAQRPFTLDYVERIFTDWSEIHGDRAFGDDAAIVCGMARYHGEEVMVIGHQKGRDTKQRVYRNFGQANPEGYRKALRCMKLAEKFGRPIFTFIDTPGAYPGLGAEERGQAEAIARNLREMAKIEVPIITTVTGEGGSGGALALAVSDRVFMMENSIYSVISPEGCASIMWRDAAKKEVAAQALRITAPDLKEMKIIDEIIPEPDGGAHTDHDAAAALVDQVLQRHFDVLKSQPASQLLDGRYEKFRNMAQFFTE